MNISEAKDQLESLKIDRKSFLENDAEHDEMFLKDIEAIETVLQALEDKDLDEANIRADAMLDMDKIWRNKMKEKIEKQIQRIDKLLEDMIDKSIGCINVSYLSKKEKEEVIAKRNSLIVQKATLQQVLEELLKGELNNG